MANNINRFVDDMQISIENTLTHLLHSENSDELNVIRHSHTSVMIVISATGKL